MAVKFEKLVGYKPFWIYADGKYPRSHIEDILQTVSYNNKRSLKGLKKFTRQMSNEEHWIETTDYKWENIWRVTGSGTLDKIADYLKVTSGDHVYYYYLLNKTERVRTTEGDEPYFDAEYEFDEYMTVFWHKLEILRSYNPTVYVKFGFNNRWSARIDDNGITEYIIDYVAQKWISSTLADRNNLMVRELAYFTTAGDIYDLNFTTVIPLTYTVNRYNTGADAITITGFQSKLTYPNSRGRYEYIIAKSSAKMNINNSKLLPSQTDQQTIIIPLFESTKDEILHALNDFDTTSTGEGFLVPFGENEMGIWECDIPYSFFWGCVAENKYGAKMEYAHQRMPNDQYIDVPFFTIDNNAPILLKIIDYAKYENGFYGKFLNMIRNITLWIPETEPAMWNPSYYQEVYNNGETELTIDAAKFKFHWNSGAIEQFGVEAYLSLSAQLALAYNFGNNTNFALATYDNTATIIGKGSITNLYVGSNSSNYFTTNSAAIATGLSNRQSEEDQAWKDAALNSAKMAIDAIPNNIVQALNPFRTVKKAASAAIGIAQTMYDTTAEQERANRAFRASVNNITTAPQQTLADPSVKGVIPNRFGLFETYAKKLHPDDERVIFTNYLHNGYPIDAAMLIDDVLNNRQIMNVLNFDTTKYEDDLMSILTEHDDTIFNTKFWNKRFLAWMNSANNIYNTTRLVNCTDYMGAGYLSNIESELPDTPIIKENIAIYITNFRTEYEANESIILANLMEDNPDAPEDIWYKISINYLEFGGFVISALPDPDNEYYGTIVVQATCYRGYINDTDDGIHHYFWDVDFLCKTSFSAWTITCPDGKTYSTQTFNYEIIFMDDIKMESIGNGFLNRCTLFNHPVTLPNSLTTIGSYFMSYCRSFNQPVTLPNGITSIGQWFLYYDDSFNQPVTLPNSLTTIGSNFICDCDSFNQPVTLPNSLTSIGDSFMVGTRNFNQPLTLPNSLNSVGKDFMFVCYNMTSQINIQNLEANIFVESVNTLATSDSSQPIYVNGVEIVGAKKTAFLARFPNRTTDPYRKLK